MNVTGFDRTVRQIDRHDTVKNYYIIDRTFAFHDIYCKSYWFADNASPCYY